MWSNRKTDVGCWGCATAWADAIFAVYEKCPGAGVRLSQNRYRELSTSITHPESFFATEALEGEDST